MALFIILFIPEIGLLLGKNIDSEIFIIISLITTAYFFQVLLFIPNIQFFLSKKLIYTSFSIIIQITSFFGFSYLFIPNYGLYGIAFSFLLSNFIVLFINNYFGNKVFAFGNSNVILFSFLIIIFLVTILFFLKYVIEIGFMIFIIKSIFIGFFVFNFYKNFINILK